MESRLRQIRIAKPSSPVWLVTEVTKWNQRIPKIHDCITLKDMLSLQVSRAHVDEELVSDALAKLTDDHRYSLSELQQRPLPEGVDAQRLETYLGDEEFQV